MNDQKIRIIQRRLCELAGFTVVAQEPRQQGSLPGNEEKTSIMSFIQRLIILSALCGFLGCGGPADTGIDNPPPEGNLWIIGDPSKCTDNDILTIRAQDACAPYSQKPRDLAFLRPCLSWYIGIGGPYAIPGAYQLSFRCW